MGCHSHYHVQVIELSKPVLYKGRFEKASPDYVTDKLCVYVGMTCLDPACALTNTRQASSPIDTCSNSDCGCCLPSTGFTTRCPVMGRATWQ